MTASAWFSSGVITTVAGHDTQGSGGDNGPATKASLYLPEGLALDNSGTLYIADWENSRVREVSNGVITTFAGNGICCAMGDGGPAASTALEGPAAVAVDASGNVSSRMVPASSGSQTESSRP